VSEKAMRSRAVSQVVSALLLTLTVMGLMTFLLNQFDTITRSSSAYLISSIKSKTEAAQELISILDALPVNEGLTVLIYNYGELDVKISKLYVNGTLFNVNITIPGRSLKQVIVPVATSRGSYYQVAIETMNGVVHKYGFQAL